MAEVRLTGAQARALRAAADTPQPYVMRHRTWDVLWRNRLVHCERPEDEWLAIITPAGRRWLAEHDHAG